MNLSEHHPSVVLAEGGAVGRSELKAAGYTDEELDGLRRSYEILEWSDRFGGRHYPIWQFDSKWSVLRGVRDILRIFRSRDVLYVMSQFIVRRDRRPSLLQLIRLNRAKRAAELARALVRADRAEPKLPPRWRKEIRRRFSEMTDPIRHVVASSMMGRRVMVYDLENNCYAWGHVPKTSLVKDRSVAQALARHLSVRQKRPDLQVLRVRPGAKTIRALEKVRRPFGRRSLLPSFTTGETIPIFVPITQAGGRERIADSMLFALENQDRLLPLIRSAKSRSFAINALVRRCSMSRLEASAIMDLRFGHTTRESINELRAEVRTAVRRCVASRKHVIKTEETAPPSISALPDFAARRRELFGKSASRSFAKKSPERRQPVRA